VCFCCVELLYGNNNYYLLGGVSMFAKIGRIQKELKVAKLDSRNQQNLEKEEKEHAKRMADMDPLAWQIIQYKEDIEKMNKNNQMSSIDTKLKSGGELTPEEIEYLKKNNPDTYREYQEVKLEKETYKRQLKSCKTKEEVEKLKLNKMGNFMAEAKSIVDNPVIPKDKKRALMEKLLKKTMSVQEAHLRFTKTEKYQNLPTEEEITEKVIEKIKTIENPQKEKSILENFGKAEWTKEEKLEMDDKDVKGYMIEYLTLDRPSGYGLEYY